VKIFGISAIFCILVLTFACGIAGCGGGGGGGSTGSGGGGGISPGGSGGGGTPTDQVLTSILIEPTADQIVNPGEQILFTATGFDQNGNVVAANFTWTNADANGKFQQTVAGDYIVQARSGDVNSNIVKVTVRAPTMGRVIVHTAGIAPDGTTVDIYKDGVPGIFLIGVSHGDIATFQLEPGNYRVQVEYAGNQYFDPSGVAYFAIVVGQEYDSYPHQ